MNTYRVVVCDDDSVILDNICSLCREIFTEDGINYEITVFSSSVDLKKKMDTQTNLFDLLILDIQMEGMTGIELAHYLRNRGDRISIIFITACDDYLSEGYDVQPIHFLLKPVKKEALSKALRTDLKLNYFPKTVTFHIGSKNICFTLADILYIESFNYEIIIHQMGLKRSDSISLVEMERQLPPNQFCRCHKSYIVNLSYVQEIGRTELSLQSGDKLPIGRTYYKLFQEMFIRYLNK